MKIRKHLSASGLLRRVRQSFGEIEDPRPGTVKISLADALLTGFALFSLKDPSLLAFEARRAKPENLHAIYGIEQVPSDTQLRTILDEVLPAPPPCRSARWSRSCLLSVKLPLNWGR